MEKISQILISIIEQMQESVMHFSNHRDLKGMTVMKLLKLAAKDELSDKGCCDLLTAVGLCAKDYIYRQIDGTLSGGEMKRIEIASVLAKEHSLCIFDEPEAGIDLWSFSMLIQKFEEIHTEKSRALS